MARRSTTQTQPVRARRVVTPLAVALGVLLAAAPWTAFALTRDRGGTPPAVIGCRLRFTPPGEGEFSLGIGNIPRIETAIARDL